MDRHLLLVSLLARFVACLACLVRKFSFSGSACSEFGIRDNWVHVLLLITTCMFSLCGTVLS